MRQIIKFTYDNFNNGQKGVYTITNYINYVVYTLYYGKKTKPIDVNELARLVKKYGNKQMSGRYRLELIYSPEGEISIVSAFGSATKYKCLSEKQLFKDD